MISFRVIATRSSDTVETESLSLQTWGLKDVAGRGKEVIVKTLLRCIVGNVGTHVFGAQSIQGTKIKELYGST